MHVGYDEGEGEREVEGKSRKWWAYTKKSFNKM
jgi:hypothetical protein